MAKSVFCIAANEPQAETIVTALKAAGFDGDDISVLFPDRHGSKHFAHEQHTKAPEGIAVGAGSGGVVGGLLGVLATAGALAIPGIGPLLAAGPVLTALSAAAVGAAIGGITGALVGLGIPEFEAKRYEGEIRGGNILLAVHAETAARVAAAREVFVDAAARDITVAEEATPTERS